MTALLTIMACSFALSACSGDRDGQLAQDMVPPKRVDVLAPPMAPDPSDMHPALQIARSRGLKTNVYFNEELQQAVARLHGMEETLGRLQSDLQGTAMAMQRVEMMRQEIEGLNIRIQSLQERLLYAGPVIAAEAPAQPEPDLSQPAQEVVTPPVSAVSTPPAAAQTPTQISKPVVETVAPAKSASPVLTGDGVAGVRLGTHPDRVRIVLDVNGSTKFSTHIDNGEKLLTVELPETGWSAAKTQAFKGMPVVDSYMAQGEGKGTIVAFTLKGETKILEMKTLKGSGGRPSRVIIDLAK